MLLKKKKNLLLCVTYDAYPCGCKEEGPPACPQKGRKEDTDSDWLGPLQSKRCEEPGVIWENTLLSLRVRESLSKRGCLFYLLKKTEGMTEWGGKIFQADGTKRSSIFLAPHSSTLAWKIPWMEERGRLQSMESLRVGHN